MFNVYLSSHTGDAYTLHPMIFRLVSTESKYRGGNKSRKIAKGERSDEREDAYQNTVHKILLTP